jgi:hypothetical protein
LYGQDGLKILQYYKDGENGIELGDIEPDVDLDGWIAGNGNLVIQIEEDIDVVTAASYLATGLEWSLPYLKNQITAAEDYATLAQAWRVTARSMGQVTGAAARLYLAGIGIVNEGADWVVTVSEIADGHYEAAVGFLPAIPASVFRNGGKFLLKNTAGQVVLEMTESMVAAFRRAETAQGLAAKWTELAPLNLSLNAREFLVESGFLPVATDRLALRRAMPSPPAGLVNPQAHHNLPWTFREWFAMHGLDVNLPQYGRWVDGTPPGRHQNWTPAFQAQWQAFISAEPVSCYTQQQILDFMNVLSSSPNFR